jgi:2-polyprenyl-3-methyl-5-hydroxy-6-metoxy-1,4-benzoquinol methylase
MIFEQSGDRYENVVQKSIDFAGVQYDVFVRAKARVLKDLASQKWGQAAAQASLLDVGCGAGFLHPHLAESFGTICGTDSSDQLITSARERNPASDYRTMSSDRIPYPDSCFDMVTAINVLHHVVPSAWMNFAAELTRVVRPNGLLCIIEHNPYNPLTRLAVYRCPFDADANLLKPSQTRRLLSDVGLCRVEIRHFLFTPLSGRLAVALENAFVALPMGAQYLAFGEKMADANGTLGK